MKKSVLKKLAAGLLAGVMLFSAGCGSASSGNKETTAAETQETSVEKHVNVAFFWVSTDLDPAVDYNGWVTSRLGVGESLVKLNDNLELEGCVADTWENVDDTTWTFHIRDGITFSNGTPVTAEAAKLSIERAVTMNDRAAEYLKIDTIEADGQTLTIKTTQPNAALLNNLVEPVFNIIDTTQSEEIIQTAPVATGPYVVTAFSSEQTVELQKNENYWGGEVGLDTITVTQITDANARAMAIQSGEMDITNTIDNTSVQLFADESMYHVSSIISPRVNVAYMNNAETSPLSDIQLRKAVSYAVDRESYVKLIGGSVAHSAYSDATPFGNETIDALGYDLELAVSTLDAAGYKDVDGDGYRENTDGSQLILQYLQAADHGSNDSAILATAIQSDLKKAGIHMEIMAVENLSDYQTTGEFDFYTANDNSAPTGDPQIWLETMYTGLGTSGKKNLTSYQSDEIDRIVEEMKITFDTQARYQLAAQASQVLNDDAANLFLTNSYLNMVSSAKVKNANQPVCDYYFITKDITVE
ncbi:MAG: ABC transporter substrate-binding protein [Ruminococcus sp.]|nr:ABC transporter substrate-binding protein [Ruminococcus sp.]